MPALWKGHHDLCSSYGYSDVSQSAEARPQEVPHGEDQLKIAIGSLAVVVAATVAAAAYTAWLNVVEERQRLKAQPLLGVVYRR